MSLDSLTYRLFGAKWYFIHPPIHLYYYSHATLRALLERAGLAVLAVEPDDSRSPTPLRLARAVTLGWLNRLMFQIYGRPRGWGRALRPLLRPLQGRLSDERMAERVANLYPGHYAGRMRDVFVWVSAPAEALRYGERHRRTGPEAVAARASSPSGTAAPVSTPSSAV
jgi:hypothetical protein